jgi:hypothetical protein
MEPPTWYGKGGPERRCLQKSVPAPPRDKCGAEARTSTSETTLRSATSSHDILTRGLPGLPRIIAQVYQVSKYTCTAYFKKKRNGERLRQETQSWQMNIFKQVPAIHAIVNNKKAHKLPYSQGSLKYFINFVLLGTTTCHLIVSDQTLALDPDLVTRIRTSVVDPNSFFSDSDSDPQLFFTEVCCFDAMTMQKGDDFRAFFPSWGENRFFLCRKFVIFDP